MTFIVLSTPYVSPGRTGSLHFSRLHKVRQFCLLTDRPVCYEFEGLPFIVDCNTRTNSGYQALSFMGGAGPGYEAKENYDVTIVYRA